MIFASIAVLVVGTGMIGQWIMFLATGQVPELKTEPLRIRFPWSLSLRRPSACLWAAPDC